MMIIFLSKGCNIVCIVITTVDAFITLDMTIGFVQTVKFSLYLYLKSTNHLSKWQQTEIRLYRNSYANDKVTESRSFFCKNVVYVALV